MTLRYTCDSARAICQRSRLTIKTCSPFCFNHPITFSSLKFLSFSHPPATAPVKAGEKRPTEDKTPDSLKKAKINPK